MSGKRIYGISLVKISSLFNFYVRECKINYSQTSLTQIQGAQLENLNKQGKISFKKIKKKDR